MSRDIEYYTGLITSQHQTATKFMAFVEAIIGMMGEISDCADSMREAFDIDTATGFQLDVIGQIVGLSRTLPFTPTTTSSAVLDDSYYRKALKAKIAVNQWDGQISSLSPLWADIFPGANIAVVDNADMTMDITFADLLPGIFQEMIENGMIVPRPQGVLSNFYFSARPRFTYSKSGSGYNQGYWV